MTEPAIPSSRHLLLLVLALVLALSHGTAARAQAPDAAPRQEQDNRDAGIPGGQTVRGTISSIAGDTVRIRTERGQTLEVATSTNTRIVKQRQTAKLSDLRVGDGVGAAGVLDTATNTLHAVMLFAVDAAEIRKAQENLGKTFITGRITAINDLKITVKRPDDVTQVIEVDEGTSFRRGGRSAMRPFAGGPETPDRPLPPSNPGQSPRSEGESITLADLKVGDTLFATGALKEGTFHPVELRIGGPHHHTGSTAPVAQP